MAGFDNDVMFADNVDFSGAASVTGQVTTDGQLLIGSTASPNIAVGTMTAGTNIGVTNGSGSITIAFDGTLPIGSGGTGATTFTDGGVLIGNGTSAVQATSAGTSGQLLQSGGAGVDPDWTNATYPKTTTQGDILISSASNTVSILSKDTNATRYLANTGAGNNPSWDQVELTDGVSGILPVTNGGTGIADPTDHVMLVGSGAAAMTELGVATNGQLIIGSTTADPVLATLTDGTGISTSVGAGAITINAVGGGVTWSIETGASAALVANQGIIANRGSLVTLTLPATSSIGDVFEIVNIGAGFVKIAQNAGDDLRFGTSTTTTGAGGSITATALGDSVKIVSQADGIYLVLSSIGNWTIV